MNPKTTYFVSLFACFFSPILGTITETQVIRQERNNNQIITPLPSNFFPKEIPSTIVLTPRSGMAHTLSKNLIPDNSLAKKFLTKAQKPSKVSFTAFLDDYREQVEAFIKVLKTENQVFNLFNAKTLNIYTLYSLRKISSQLEAMHHALSQEDGTSNPYGKLDVEQMESKLQEIESIKNRIWCKKFSFNNIFNQEDHFCISFIKSSLLFIYYYIACFSLVDHIRTIGFHVVSSDILIMLGLAIFLSLTSIIVGIYFRRSRKIVQASIVSAVDSILMIFFNFILCSNRNPLLCNPLGLVLPFWHYYTMKYTISPISDPRYKAFVDLLEKEKKFAINLNTPRKSIKSLHTLSSKQTLVLLPEIIQIILSFLDMQVAMQEVYPKLLQNIKTKYYNEIAILPTTIDRRAQNLSCCKKLINALFTITIFIGIFYFGFSVFSVGRITKTFYWDPFTKQTSAHDREPITFEATL